MAEDPVVSARNLRVCFGDVAAVRGVDLVLPRGRAVALVGESGSGKSVTARALIGLTGGVVTADVLRIAGHDVAGLGERGSRAERAWRRIRGRVVGTVLQDALGSLDPLRPVGAEVADAARLAGTAVDVPALLESVGLDPAAARRRPDELSGGMRQRALIAAALAADPEVVVADEPTTALDTTRQAVVLDLLRARVDAGGSLLFITHDLGAARRVADDVVILDAGRVVETGPFRTVMADPASTEGRRLVASVPWGRPRGEALLPDAAARLPGDARPRTVATQGNAPAPATPAVSVGGAVPGPASSYRSDPAPQEPERRGLDAPREASPLLSARGVVVRYGGTSEPAVRGADLTLRAGRTVGLVGESGSGKSTLLRALAGLLPVESGDVLLRGEPWSALPERRRRARRRQLAMIVQDPLGSFEPRWDVGQVLTDALGRRDPRRVADLLESVHLDPTAAHARPRTLSGGQRQRVAIARALAVEPAVLLADEPVSALDASVQAQVLDLLDELQAQRGLGIVLVSHDLGVVRHSSDDIVVLQNGLVVESGPTEDVLSHPTHPFTRELIEAAPRLS
ncbi:MAG: ABC transporter ATP-binding protein [Kocuria sp.]|uniref:ABC transporter ATP-binding protein n=1 Tax=Kocuria sp. TaxID=1871328 RepID=UPI0026DA94CE|nr:ABC transporter ATP-binding protein [Kocuria sp.]MDO4256170.1 ABC transporter ATP-binding protein [Kocuria sp.]